ncbi:MAG TPA: TetR family transcriptional regulator [Magnetospirillum sp.]|nr:TetR family transcriptional regulator [Magnetospirillum sp.]
MAPPSRRDELVEAALALFLRNGFHATGIAAILAAAGVNKMTMYHHFASKEDLVAAALELRDRRFRIWLFGRMAHLAPDDPRGRLLDMFDALGEWFRGESELDPVFRGCAFIKAAGEYGDPGDPTHHLAAEHKQRVVDELTVLCAQAGLSDPEGRAAQLALLKEGAIVDAFVRGNLESWRAAKRMAERVVA